MYNNYYTTTIYCIYCCCLSVSLRSHQQVAALITARVQTAAYCSHEEECCEQGSQYFTGSQRKLPFVLFCLCFFCTTLMVIFRQGRQFDNLIVYTLSNLFLLSLFLYDSWRHLALTVNQLRTLTTELTGLKAICPLSAPQSDTSRVHYIESYF